jgi:hypothetical protein
MATFQPGSGRETLAPLGAAALENRAAGAGRHPRAESVPAFPASNVRLEGAFHRGTRRRWWDAAGPCRPPGQYREARLPAGGSAEPRGTSGWPQRTCSKSPAERPSDQCRKICKCGNPQAKDRMATGLAPPFHNCGDCCGKEEFACLGLVFRASSRMFSSVEGPRRRCYDRRFPDSGGGSNKPACNALLN